MTRPALRALSDAVHAASREASRARDEASGAILRMMAHTIDQMVDALPAEARP